MQNKKEKLEDFKTAISSTVRSISNSRNVEVFFGNQNSNTDKKSIKLPDLQKNNDKINFEEIRAIADSKSLRFRFSNENILKKYEPVKNYIKDIKTACLWKKKSSKFNPDYCPVMLDSDPWIVQPTEHYEELSIDKIILKQKKG